MEENLKYIFDNVNNWLKFAEAKTATLLAANSAIIFGLLNLIEKYDYCILTEKYIVFVTLQLLLSSIICLASFIPSLLISGIFHSKRKENTDNLYYFLEIAKYTPLEYLKSLNHSMGNDSEETIFTNSEVMLSEQIIINSVIAKDKYYYFKSSIWLSLSAIISPVLVFLLIMFRRKK